MAPHVLQRCGTLPDTAALTPLQIILLANRDFSLLSLYHFDIKVPKEKINLAVFLFVFLCFSDCCC